MDYVLAQVNIGRLLAPLDSPRTARRGSSGGCRPRTANLSVWESVEALAAYVYGQAHIAVLQRRPEWFERMRDAFTALWWIPRGHIPTT